MLGKNPFTFHGYEYYNNQSAQIEKYIFGHLL